MPFVVLSSEGPDACPVRPRLPAAVLVPCVEGSCYATAGLPAVRSTAWVCLTASSRVQAPKASHQAAGAAGLLQVIISRWLVLSVPVFEL